MHYAGIHFFYSLVATKILNRQLFLYGNVTLRCALSIHLTDEPIILLPPELTDIYSDG
jgi:hypothetical protein